MMGPRPPCLFLFGADRREVRIYQTALPSGALGVVLECDAFKFTMTEGRASMIGAAISTVAEAIRGRGLPEYVDVEPLPPGVQVEP